MKMFAPAVLLWLLGSSHAFAQSPSADELQIREVIREQEEGWNEGRAEVYARSFNAEGAFTIIVGTTYGTKRELQERVAQILTTIFKGSVLRHQVRGVRFVRPDVAIVDLSTEMAGFVSLPPGIPGSPDGKLRTSMLQVLVKDAEGWRVAAFHNVDRTVP
jgi:uncharacterized protein (TIGR02246 family)